MAEKAAQHPNEISNLQKFSHPSTFTTLASSSNCTSPPPAHLFSRRNQPQRYLPPSLLHHPIPRRRPSVQLRYPSNKPECLPSLLGHPPALSGAPVLSSPSAFSECKFTPSMFFSGQTIQTRSSQENTLAQLYDAFPSRYGPPLQLPKRSELTFNADDGA